MTDKLKDPKKEACLQSALDAYMAALGKEPIETANKLINDKINKTPSDQLVAELQTMADENVRTRERTLKARKLAHITKLQAIQSIIQTVDNAKEKNMKNPVRTGITARIGGTVRRFTGSRDSVDAAMNTATKNVENKILSQMSKSQFTLIRSDAGQLEFLDALMRTKQGEHVSGDMGYLARLFSEYQDKGVRGLRQLGVDIVELEDRVMPNIHNPRRMLHLSRQEKVDLKGKSEADIYNYTYERWKKKMFQHMDIDRVFKQADIPLNDTSRIDEFMRDSFDNLVNKGKASQETVNIARRKNAARRFHWKTPEDLHAYNQEMGGGSIYDVVMNEIKNTQAEIEMVRYFGEDPSQTLNEAMQTLDRDPKYEGRFNKADDYKVLRSKLGFGLHRVQDFNDNWGVLAHNIQIGEAIAKLGFVVLRSVGDMGILASAVRQIGGNPFETQLRAIRYLTKGMTEDELIALSDQLDTTRKAQLNKISLSSAPGYETNRVLKKVADKMFTVNGLHRWDFSLTAAMASEIAQTFARNSYLTWEDLSDNDRDIMQAYNIGKAQWNVIRGTSFKNVDGSKMITPDLVQNVDDATIDQAIIEDHKDKENPPRLNSQTRADFRDATERSLRRYFTDRQEHVILRTDAMDHQILSFNAEQPAMRAAFKLLTTFKGYSLAYTRKVLGGILFRRGATDFKDAFFSRRSNLHEAAGLIVRMMAWSYTGMTLVNLARGLGPPDPTKPKVFLQLLTDNIGILSPLFTSDTSDYGTSLAKWVIGPTGRDLDTTIRGLSGLAKDAFTNNPRTSASENFYNMMNGYLFKNFLFDQWKAAIAPGKSAQDLHKLQQTTGATPL